MEDEEVNKMTNKEAIKGLKALSKEFSGYKPNEDMFDMAIEALYKQIPMSVRTTTSTKRCGNCGRQLSGIGNLHPERRYCVKCGQAIDWGKS